jgi:hypothetical protein
MADALKTTRRWNRYVLGLVLLTILAIAAFFLVTERGSSLFSLLLYLLLLRTWGAH